MGVPVPPQRALIGLVMREGLLAVGGGMVLGLLLSFTVGRLLESQLFGISPVDPLTYAATLGLLLLVALVACYLPARRAAKVEPTVALLGE